MKRTILAILAALSATFAYAQTPVVNCTVSCQIMTDAIVATPMPTQCRLYNNGTVLLQSVALSAVPANPTSGAPAGQGCIFNQKVNEGVTVSLTSRAVYAGVETGDSTCTGTYPCPLVFTSSAGSTADTTPPTAPTGLAAVANSPTQVSISWTAATDNVGIAAYRLERCSGNGCSNFSQLSANASSPYTDATSASTSYTYRARAIDAAGNIGPYSNVSTVTTPAMQTGNNFGETTVLPTPDGNNGGWLLASSAALGQAGTLATMSVYVTQTGGQMRLGIYDATGPSGGPGALRAQSNAFTPVAGWNTVAMTTNPTLAPATYWLVFHPSTDTIQVPDGVSGASTALYYQSTFGALPATFSVTPTAGPVHWSVYATITTVGPAPRNMRVGP